MKRGFTLVEIMIVVAIIALLAAIAIPNLMRARLTANEAAAQAALKTIATAQISYRTGNPNYATLEELGNATPPYIDDVLAAGQKNGYDFSAADDGTDNGFIARAIPTTATTGTRRFCITEDGVVRVNAAVTNATTHDTCATYDATSP
ncbi:MAG: prepilin-type N-terminal cleavage/methylation domain-containing protein [Candidatus Omnitrophica bacterium]|nr:prepilin-type N-terminal cleavage/methylation domain-containing protein [Candidatus Omnitrophota bacterium]